MTDEQIDALVTLPTRGAYGHLDRAVLAHTRAAVRAALAERGTQVPAEPHPESALAVWVIRAAQAWEEGPFANPLPGACINLRNAVIAYNNAWGTQAPAQAAEPVQRPSPEWYHQKIAEFGDDEPAVIGAGATPSPAATPSGEVGEAREHHSTIIKALADMVQMEAHEFKRHGEREFIDREQAMRIVLVIRDASDKISALVRKMGSAP
jgi:hypothetical protein